MTVPPPTPSPVAPPRPRCVARLAALGVALVLVASAVAGPVTRARRAAPVESGDTGPTIVYRPPVEAPVADPFRPPATRYGTGNRGLTYDVAAGTAVRAAAAGRVTFAGTIGVARYVTIAHADGWETTYSFLDTVVVARGTFVVAGDVVATAGPGFHFGVRDGPAYLDPAGVFARPHTEVRLVN